MEYILSLNLFAFYLLSFGDHYSYFKKYNIFFTIDSIRQRREMPFSIKRFTQLHRSSSLPNKNKQDDNKSKKKSKEQSSSSQSSTSQPVSQHKQKLSQISASRSIDAAEIRRLGGQLTISNPIPIDQPQGSRSDFTKFHL